MLNLGTQYPGKVGPPVAAYPFGEPINVSAPGAGDGTPWEEAWVKDIEGWKTALMAEAGITPTGNPETALISQLLEAMQKIAPMLNVKAFGATGDGATDDTAFIQAAIDNSVGSNGIYFPPGDYNVGTLNVPGDITLMGLGGELTLRTGTDDAVIDIAVGSENVVLQGLKINGNSANNIGTPATEGLINVGSSGASPSKYIFIDRCILLDAYQNGIVVKDDASQVKITGCVIDNVDQDAGIVVAPTGGNTSDVYVDSCTILNCTGPGIVANGIITKSDVSRNYIDGASAVGGSPLIRMRDGGNADVVIASNRLLNNAAYRGIAVGGARFIINGNNVEDFVNDGIHIEALSGAESPDCVVSNNTVTGDAAALNGITISDGPNVAITGNTVRTGQQVGIQITNTGLIDTVNGFVVAGNSVEFFDQICINIQGGAGMRDGSVGQNMVKGSGIGTTAAGIRLQDVLEVAVTGNRVDDCAIGIDEVTAGSADWNLIIANIVRGNTTPTSIPGPSNSLVLNNL